MKIDIKKQAGLKVLFLHLSNAPISFYRMVQFAEHMAEFDDIYPIYPKFEYETYDKQLHDYELNMDAHWTNLNRLFEMVDVCICASAHLTKFVCGIRALAKTYNVILLMETDDHPFEVDGVHPNAKWIGCGSEVEMNAYDQINCSHGIITSTEYLKEEMLLYKRDNVWVVPNGINPKLWKFAPHPKRADDKLVIGWSGASGHDKDLYLVKDVFLELLNKHKHLEIKCLHGAPDFIKHERFINDNIWTDITGYPAKLHGMGFDIAVAPLWDSEFNRAKSNLRYLEYSALRIPCVASGVEPYKKTITDGVDGYLASTKKEFLDKIEKLMYNVKLRSQISENAYKKVTSEFDSKKISRKYADLLKDIYSNKRGQTDVKLQGSSG